MYFKLLSPFRQKNLIKSTLLLFSFLPSLASAQMPQETLVEQKIALNALHTAVLLNFEMVNPLSWADNQVKKMIPDDMDRYPAYYGSMLALGAVGWFLGSYVYQGDSEKGMSAVNPGFSALWENKSIATTVHVFGSIGMVMAFGVISELCIVGSEEGHAAPLKATDHSEVQLRTKQETMIQQAVNGIQALYSVDPSTDSLSISDAEKEKLKSLIENEIYQAIAEKREANIQKVIISSGFINPKVVELTDSLMKKAEKNKSIHSHAQFMAKSIQFSKFLDQQEAKSFISHSNERQSLIASKNNLNRSIEILEELHLN